MFRLSRTAITQPLRAFSTSTKASHDLAKITLIGRMAREAEVRQTRAEKEYVAYTVVTNKYPSPRDDSGNLINESTFHRVLSFNPASNAYLTKIPRGSLVFVEAGYEVREPDREAEAGSYQSTRQVFLRHETIRVIRHNKPINGDGEGDHESNESQG